MLRRLLRTAKYIGAASLGMIALVASYVMGYAAARGWLTAMIALALLAAGAMGGLFWYFVAPGL